MLARFGPRAIRGAGPRYPDERTSYLSNAAGLHRALAGQTDALYVYSEPLTNANKDKIIKAANAAKIPTIFGFREFVDAGGLISYGPNFVDLFARAAEFTDKILRGATPADLPVQQPVKFALIINIKAAKLLD